MLDKVWAVSCAVALGSLVVSSAAGQEVGPVVGWGGRVIVPPDQLTNALMVDGYEHSIALRADGTIVAWGANYVGQSYLPWPCCP